MMSSVGFITSAAMYTPVYYVCCSFQAHYEGGGWPIGDALSFAVNPRNICTGWHIVSDGAAVSCVVPSVSQMQNQDRELDHNVVSGSFGRNVQVSGNRIVFEDDSRSLSAETSGGIVRKRRCSAEAPIDYSKLKK